MREIKFRAWDKTDKQMVKVDALILANNCLNDNMSPHILDEHNDIHLLNEVILMQYTGLKDINGKEIYEGDILKDTDNEIYYVDFIRGCFYLKINYHHIRWEEWLPMFEIIGNIYENPELIERRG